MNHDSISNIVNSQYPPLMLQKNHKIATPTIPTASNADAMMAIQSDMVVPNKTGVGLQWYQENDRNLLDLIAADLALIDAIDKNSTMPFQFNKTMNQIDLIKYSDIAAKSYAVLQARKYKIELPQYERGIDTQAIDLIQKYLLIDPFRLTGQPLAFVNAGGLMEGELLNSFVSRLREFVKSKNFRINKNAQAKLINQSTTKVIRLIDRLQANCAGMYAILLTFTISESTNTMVDLKPSKKLLENLVGQLSEVYQAGLLGWFCKREYASNTGYRLNFVLFFNPQYVVYDDTTYQRICCIWESITAGSGRCFNYPNFLVDQYSSKQPLNPKYGQHINLIAFIAKSMFKRDGLLSLKSQGQLPNFWLSDMPPAARVLANTYAPCCSDTSNGGNIKPASMLSGASCDA